MSERQTADGAQAKGRRQIVKFSFFKVDPAWRRLPPEAQVQGKQEFCRTVEAFGDRLLIRSYGLVGMRGDVDFLLWQIGDRLEDFQQLGTALFSTSMGPYLTTPYSYLAMTRRSVYVSPEEETRESRLVLHPTDSKYLFVYPFVKTRPWYLLPLEKRQELMNEHIRIGKKYPSVKLNTTYSFGLDDQEFVVAFETDEPTDFLDLVMELRETESSLYTLRDTPIFTCIAMGLRETLDSLGAAGQAMIPTGAAEAAPAGVQDAGAAPWARVANLAEVPPGTSKVVYHRGEQIALFNVEGRIYAVGNRCSHANSSLADGRVEGTAVTCSWHGSQFDPATGQPLCPPANRPIPTYEVRVEDGAVFLAARAPAAASQGRTTG